jgi:adenylate cyclase class 2
LSPAGETATRRSVGGRRSTDDDGLFSPPTEVTRMYEVELKVEADHGPVRGRLRELGATRGSHVVQRDTYYDAPHRDFAETDEALRVRREAAVDADAAATRLTYKGPLVDDASKTRRELETGVDDGETMDGILRSLGFSPAAVVEKERERFRVDDYVVTLDEVTDVGAFVEVEREVPESDVEAAREGAFDLLRRLGLDPERGIRTSYLGMLLDARE